MSAFKKLQLSDTSTVAYTARKNWNISGSEQSSYGIQYINGVTGSNSLIVGDESYNEKLHFKSINHLYYSNKADGSVYLTGSYENYLQTSLYYSDARILSSSIVSISIPRDIIGNNIEPSTFKVLVDDGNISSSLVDDGEGRIVFEYPYNEISSTVFLENGIDADSSHTKEVYTSILTEEKLVSSISQGSEGFLYGFFYDGLGDTPSKGDIIYSHGIVNLNIQDSITPFTGSDFANLYWTSNYDVFTSQYTVELKDSEFNFSQNPSTHTNQSLNSNITGSEFTPYVTSIGLYNDVNDLIAVAKLSRPVPKSKDTDMTFVINLDM